MILTETMILAKAKGYNRASTQQDTSRMKTVNLWGQNLTDVSVLGNLPQLEIVSLAVNAIKDLSCFSNLKRLRELYLRKNQIADPQQLLHLRGLPLTDLWLAENPVVSIIPNYRHLLIRLFPTLTRLDDSEVTQSERKAAQSLLPAKDDDLIRLLVSRSDPSSWSPTEQDIPRVRRSPPPSEMDIWRSAIRNVPAPSSLPSAPISFQKPAVQTNRRGLAHSDDHLSLPGMRVVNEPVHFEGKHPRRRVEQEHLVVHEGMLPADSSSSEDEQHENRIARFEEPHDLHLTGASLMVANYPEKHKIRRGKEPVHDDHLSGAGLGVVAVDLDPQANAANKNWRRRKDCENDGGQDHLNGAGIGVEHSVTRVPQTRIKHIDFGEKGGAGVPYAIDSESFTVMQTSLKPKSPKRPSWLDKHERPTIINKSIRDAEMHSIRAPEHSKPRSNNVLHAVLSLLSELDPAALDVVQHKLDVIMLENRA